MPVTIQNHAIDDAIFYTCECLIGLGSEYFAPLLLCSQWRNRLLYMHSWLIFPKGETLIRRPRTIISILLKIISDPTYTASHPSYSFPSAPMPLKIPRVEPDIGNVHLLASFVTAAVTADSSCQSQEHSLGSARNSATTRKLTKIFRTKMSVEASEVHHHLHGAIFFCTKDMITFKKKKKKGQFDSCCVIYSYLNSECLEKCQSWRLLSREFKLLNAVTQHTFLLSCDSFPKWR